ARRRRVGVEIDSVVFGRDLGNAVGHAPMHGSDEEAAILARDKAFRDTASGRGSRFGIGRDPLDLAAQNPALRIELFNGEPGTAQVVLAAVSVLAAGVTGESDFDRLLLALSVDAIVLPRAE